MKIGIITDYLDFQTTGIGNYVKNLVEYLHDIDKKNEYTLIHIKKGADSIYNRVRDITVPLPAFPPRAIIRKNLLIPKVLKKGGFDLIHEPLQITPFLLRLPMRRVITIHDISCLLPPNINRWAYLYNRYTLSRAVKISDMIITISESSKRDIVKHLDVPEDRIKVIYHGLNKSFKPLDELGDITKEYGIDYPFILYVGKVEPRKNIPTLIKSFYKLKKRGIKHKLVMVTQKEGGYRRLLTIIRDLGLRNEVIVLESMSNEDLVKMYNMADLFVFPSIYEGFGLPPLEAMGCGTPVITSNSSSLPEVVGDAGIMVNPYDTDALTNAMQEVLTNEELRKNLIKRGLARAKQFSWEKTAKETIEVYERLLMFK